MAAPHTASSRSIAMALLLGLLAWAAPARADDAALRQQIVGTWGEQPECSGDRIAFAADGSVTVGSGADAANGRYSIADGAITLIPLIAGSEPVTSPLTISGDQATIMEGDRPSVIYRCAPAR